MRHDVEPPLSCAARQRCRPCRARIRRDQDGKGTPRDLARQPQPPPQCSPRVAGVTIQGGLPLSHARLAVGAAKPGERSDLAQALWLGTGNAATWASDTEPRPRVSPGGAAGLPKRLRQHKDNCSGTPVPIVCDKLGVSSHWILYRTRVTHEKWIFL